MVKLTFEFETSKDAVIVLKAQELVFEFETPQEALVLLKSQALAGVLFDFDNYLRNMCRYPEEGTPQEITDKVMAIREELLDSIRDAGATEVVFGP